MFSFFSTKTPYDPLINIIKKLDPEKIKLNDNELKQFEKLIIEFINNKVIKCQTQSLPANPQNNLKPTPQNNLKTSSTQPQIGGSKIKLKKRKTRRHRHK
jgi:hypothetical protein